MKRGKRYNPEDKCKLALAPTTTEPANSAPLVNTVVLSTTLIVPWLFLHHIKQYYYLKEYYYLMYGYT